MTNDSILTTYDARDTAANQRRPGYVIPMVNAKTSRKNCVRGNLKDPVGSPGDRWFAIAMFRPLQSAGGEWLVVAVRYKKCKGNIIQKVEWTM